MDVGVELRQVTEQLEGVEEQLSALLEKQSQLLQRKRQLEKAAKEQQATNAAQKWDTTDFPWSKKLQETLESVFHIQRLRPLQLETMNATMSGQDCFLIMPTGGGKSLCFQLPALLSKGVSIVVSPLVSLMDDQLYALGQLGINAALLNASSSKQEVNRIHAEMTDKNTQLKLLYVTPEKLAKSKRFMNKLEKMHSMGLMARLVIDEVHCCSQWGHDFRPDYKFLGIMKKQFPGVPILGLTATATNAVLQDVQKILRVPGCLIFQASFNRHNLFYEVRSKPSGKEVCMDELRQLISSQFSGQSGIIYCFSQKDTEEVAAELRSRSIKASAYHANTVNRSGVHQDWIHNRIQIVVATVAFGMGIDKPDVRFVIHHSISKSMENYYQESGRAGRDDAPAVCILYANFADVFRQSTMVFTEQTGLEKLYNMVAYAYDKKRCRRSLIAGHFGEAWDRKQCHAMCDHCKKDSNTYKDDITSHARNIIKLLRHAKDKDQRITGNKLVEIWMGKGPPALRLSYIKPPQLSREDAERVVVHLLVQGYLQEDFHFTPYSTISYVVPGSRSHALEDPDHTVEMVSVSRGSAKSFSSLKSSSSLTQQAASTVKPSFINPTNSKFTTVTSPPSDPSPSTSNSSQSTSNNSKKKATVKRRANVIESDSDSDLDFDDDKSTTKRKSGDVDRKKKSKSSDSNGKKSTEKANAGASNEKKGKRMSVCVTKKPACIQLDSDSDTDFGEEDVMTKAVNGVHKKSALICLESDDENYVDLK